MKLASSDGKHSCEIKLFGATVISWISNGLEKLFLSSAAHLDGSKAIRGGIPLVFPQFGQPDAKMAQHGFARNKIWKIGFQGCSESNAKVEFLLEDDEQTQSVWPFKFKLSYIVELQTTSLTTTLHITNPSEDSSFQCQSLLHTYLRVPRIQSILVDGFQGFDYIDKMNNGLKLVDTNEAIVIDREIDRVYCAKKDNALVINVHDIDQKVKLYEVHSAAKLYEFSDNSVKNEHDIVWINTDVVLWNAWIEKAKALADMNDDGYLYYICVEPGLVAQNVEILPRNTLEVFQKIQV